jgi:hypothetical protein
VLFVLAAATSDEALHSYRATQYDPIPPLDLAKPKFSEVGYLTENFSVEYLAFAV